MSLTVLGVLGAPPASEVAPGLYIGGFPRYPERLHDDGIDVLVLAAAEFQPHDTDFPGVEVIHAPWPKHKGEPSRSQIYVAVDAANQVQDKLDEGKTVLITCWLGKHRSGLITAFTLMGKYGLTGAQAMAQIKAARPIALNTGGLTDFLNRLPVLTGEEHQVNHRLPSAVAGDEAYAVLGAMGF